MPLNRLVGKQSAADLMLQMQAALEATANRSSQNCCGSRGTVPIFVAGRHKNGTVPFGSTIDTNIGTDS